MGLKLMSLKPTPHMASLPNLSNIGFFLTIYKVYNNAYWMRLLRTLFYHCEDIVTDSQFPSWPCIEEGSVCSAPSSLLLQQQTELERGEK